MHGDVGYEDAVTTPPPAAAPEAVAALAPTGTLRAAINLSNFLLVTGEDDGGLPVGVSPDVARALADALGVGITLLPYPSPGAVADDASSGRWDIGNIGAEPQRAEHIAFTAAYCEIEATCLVPAGSSIETFADVDRPGVRIVAKERAAYCLWLERNLGEADLVQVDSHDAARDTLAAGDADVLASLRPRLLDDLAAIDGGRILADRFATVQQAIGTPRDRDPAGFDYLRSFVSWARASGLVADLIERHGVTGKLVPA